MKDQMNSQSKTINQWVALNSVLKTQKIIGLCQGGGVVLLSLLCLIMVFQDPVVVMLKDGEKTFIKAKRQKVVIEKSDIEHFIKEFVISRYSWDEFSQKSILDKIRPFTDDGLYKKLKLEFRKNKDLSIKGKKIRQIATDIKVDINETQIIASFYKLLIIEGIPLPIVSQISFKLEEGTITKSNPLGMYVAGILEHESETK